MDSRIVIVVVFLVAALVGLLIARRYALGVKRDLDTAPPSVAGVSGIIELAPASVEQLRQMSVEPILFKQTEGGVRIQIEQRPMLPMMAFADKQTRAAIAETAAEVTKRYGLKWVVLVSAADDGRTTVQRLA